MYNGRVVAIAICTRTVVEPVFHFLCIVVPSLLLHVLENVLAPRVTLVIVALATTGMVSPFNVSSCQCLAAVLINSL